jgi:hypothetical protein
MAEMHCAVAGLVSHKKMLRGKTFIRRRRYAAARSHIHCSHGKGTGLFVPGMFTMPSLVAVR